MRDYVTTWGDPKNPTVVLLHPAGATRHSWTPHAEELRDDYHVVALDLPAHGIHPDSKFTFDRAVEDVGAILEAVDSAVVVGHSQGGYVAMRAAEQHENRIDGLLLAGASANWRSPKLLAMTVVFYPLSFVLSGIAYSDRMSKWVSERFGERSDPLQEPPSEEDTYSSLHGEAQSIRAGVFQQTWPYAEAYDGPVVVAHGEAEPLQTHAKELAERADARLEWYEGGHQAPMTDSKAFATIVRDHLEDVYAEKRYSATHP